MRRRFSVDWVHDPNFRAAVPAASRRPEGAHGAHPPRRHLRGQLRMAAGQGIRRGRGPPQGRKRLPGSRHRAPGTAARGHLPGNQGPHPGDGPVRPEPQGRLVVLHPLRGGQGVRHPVPRPRPRTPATRWPTGLPRRWRPASKFPARKSCWTATWRPKASRSSPWAGSAVDRGRQPATPTPWTTPGTNASPCASRTCRTGELLPDVIENVFYGVSFSPDGTRIFYTVVDESWRPYQVKAHVLGTPVSRG